MEKNAYQTRKTIPTRSNARAQILASYGLIIASKNFCEYSIIVTLNLIGYSIIREKLHLPSGSITHYK